mmetsp:Transcript_21908/g.50389  ORF Transcript_21908/g.50389 Transcript_21908/m.50389 type:complete len:236 (+) Transcript_21908:686-1393(+)
MPRRALCRADLDLGSVLLEDAFVGERLELIVERSGSAVGVDVVHLRRCKAGRVQSKTQTLSHPLALGVRRCDVVGVARRGVASNLAVNLRAACDRVLLRLKQQHACALSHDEARPVRVERPAGGLWRIVRGRAHGTHAIEASEAERRHRRLAAARQHHVGLVVLNVLERFAKRVGARGTRAHNAKIGSLGAEFDGDHGASRVADERWEQEGRDALGPLIEKDFATLLHRGQASNA